METMMLFCNTGVLSPDIGSYGINPHDTENIGYCMDGFGDSVHCSDRVDKAFVAHYLTECANKQFCILKNLDSYFNGPADRCNHDNSVFFLNVKCLQSLEEVNTKRMESHYIITLGILICFIFLIMLYYAKNVLKITAKKWDLDMITASDYTVSYNISKREYEDFRKGHNEENGEAAAYAYMTVLKDKFEKLVSEEPHVFEETKDIQIANISYSFNNHKMIRMLDKRGDAIVAQNLEQKEKVEKEIEDHKGKISLFLKLQG